MVLPSAVSGYGPVFQIKSQNSLLGKVEGHAEVVKDISRKFGAEQQRCGIDVGEQHKGIRVCNRLAQDSSGFENDLVSAEVVALEEYQLIFVGEIQWSLSILHEAEVEGLHARG